MSITREQINVLNEVVQKELSSRFLHGKITLERMKQLSNEAQLDSLRWESVVDKVIEMEKKLK